MTPYYTQSKKHVLKRWAYKFEHRAFYGDCVYCGVSMNLASCRHLDSEATLEHVIPASRGGKLLVYACRGCNNDKHDLSLAEWRVIRFMRTRRILFHFEVCALRGVCTILLWQFNQYVWRFA